MRRALLALTLTFGCAPTGTLEVSPAELTASAWDSTEFRFTGVPLARVLTLDEGALLLRPGFSLHIGEVSLTLQGVEEGALVARLSEPLALGVYDASLATNGETWSRESAVRVVTTLNDGGPDGGPEADAEADAGTDAEADAETDAETDAEADASSGCSEATPCDGDGVCVIDRCVPERTSELCDPGCDGVYTDDCALTCPDATSCSPTCNGAFCAFSGAGGETLDVACGGGSSCAVDCTEASTCEVKCRGNSICQVDCAGSSSCLVDCNAGDCEVDCRGSTGVCGITRCGGSCSVDCTDASGECGDDVDD